MFQLEYRKLRTSRWKHGHGKVIGKTLQVFDANEKWISQGHVFLKQDIGILGCYEVQCDEAVYVNILQDIKVSEGLVFDYSCLYSTQLQKKVKSTEDGYLKIVNERIELYGYDKKKICLLYTSPSPRD